MTTSIHPLSQEKVTIRNGEIIRTRHINTSNTKSTLYRAGSRREFVNDASRHLFTGLLAGTITTLKEVKERVAHGAKVDKRHLKAVFRALDGPLQEYQEIVRYFIQELGIRPTEGVFKIFFCTNTACKIWTFFLWKV